MARKIVKKLESSEKITVKRSMLGLYDDLTIFKNRCNGCGICVKACYKEALKLSDAITHKGRLVKKGQVAIDTDKCTFCGVCAVLCPTNAIKMFRNGKPTSPAIDSGMLPHILKDFTIDVEKCDPTCKLACKVNCPTEAISIDVEERNGNITKIIGVHVDFDKCIFCGKCEQFCPQKAMLVMKPFHGMLRLNVSRCPKGCQACVDVCPSGALTLDESGKIKVEERFCIYCGACEKVCPEKAIEVKITRVSYDKIASRAWLSILEKLVSPEYAQEELYVSSIKNYLGNLEKAAT
jgi:4Fe-4S ferredoxin